MGVTVTRRPGCAGRCVAVCVCDASVERLREFASSVCGLHHSVGIRFPSAPDVEYCRCGQPAVLCAYLGLVRRLAESTQPAVAALRPAPAVVAVPDRGPARAAPQPRPVVVELPAA